MASSGNDEGSFNNTQELVLTQYTQMVPSDDEDSEKSKPGPWGRLVPVRGVFPKIELIEDKEVS